MSEISDNRHISDSNDNINNSEINYFVMTKNVMNKKCDKEKEKKLIIKKFSYDQLSDKSIL